VAGAFILFDLTNRNSFQKISFWINEIKEKGDNPNMPLVLVGNKLDLESKRVITTEEAQIIAKHYDMQYFEVSAKTGENVHNAFEALIKEIYENMDKEKLGVGIRAHFSKENQLLLNKPKKNNVLFDCCCIS
jgi:GTPase SAR1 family protein